MGKILSGPLDYVVFSIDGLEDTNHIYRRNTNFKKIMDNARAYIETGASAHWDMLVFEHNKHQVQQCRDMAMELGFNWFRSKTTDRWDIYPQDTLRPTDPYEDKNYSDQHLSVRKTEMPAYSSTTPERYGPVAMWQKHT